MIKTLARSIREFKKPAILTPLLVTVEVILECIIPFIIANLVNQMQAGCGMDVIVNYGIAAGRHGRAVADFRRRGRQHLRHRIHRFCAQPAPGYVLPHSGLFF